MNFVDYCIATKNYSALSAVNEYSKMFGRTNPGITDPEKRKQYAEDLLRQRNEDLLIDRSIQDPKYFENDNDRKLNQLWQRNQNPIEDYEFPYKNPKFKGFFKSLKAKRKVDPRSEWNVGLIDTIKKVRNKLN